jgi:hypothetical protein
MFHRLAELRMLEPFLLLPRRWEEGGLVGGCRVVVDRSETTLCVPAEDFQLAVAEQQNLFQKSSRILTGFEGFCTENNSGM